MCKDYDKHEEICASLRKPGLDVVNWQVHYQDATSMCVIPIGLVSYVELHHDDTESLNSTVCQSLAFRYIFMVHNFHAVEKNIHITLYGQQLMHSISLQKSVHM